MNEFNPSPAELARYQRQDALNAAVDLAKISGVAQVRVVLADAEALRAFLAGEAGQ